MAIRLAMKIVSLSILAGCGSSRPIGLFPAPSADRMGSISCPETGAKYYVGEVVDKRGNANLQNVGFTQTGAFNVQTPLLVSPVPSDIIGTVLSSFLERCHAKSRDRAGADLSIDTSLITLQVTEITSGFSETISVELRCEFVIRASATGRLARRFIVESASEKSSGLDTTRFASAIVEDAIASLIGRLAGELGRCPAEAVD